MLSVRQIGINICKSNIEIKRMDNMKSIQKTLLFFLNMAIAVSLCFASQNNVLAKSKMPIENKVVSPPLSPDLTWKSLGNVQKDVHVHGQILTLNGNSFESIEDGQNKNSEILLAGSRSLDTASKFSWWARWDSNP